MATELDDGDPRTLAEGRYEVQSLLGEGSMGRTYLARRVEDDALVAIKALYPSRLATVKDLELFMRESEILQKLSHAQIPSYVDAFTEGDGESACYYLAQSYVEGTTLREKIQEGTRWDEPQVVDFGKQIVRILRYMHGCDPPVVHRDIKPDNIIVNGEGVPTLVDFGAVREVVRLTMGGGSTIIGSYGYMPPEQLMGRAIPSSDIYSTGITLLEMLTRQTPGDLHGADSERLVGSANVSEPLRRILRRMVAPSEKDRYGSAAELLEDIDGLDRGGALVHAGAIETAIQQREKEAERAIKAASTPGLVHVGYITLIMLVLGSAVMGVGFVVKTLAASFESAILIAGALSGGGALMTLILLALRYMHDAWMPPSSGWRKTVGTVTSVDVSRFDPDYANSEIPRGTPGVIGYTFDAAGKRYEFTYWMNAREEFEDYEVGQQFVIYYDPKNPTFHEREDWVKDPHRAMTRLFSPHVEHTPE